MSFKSPGWREFPQFMSNHIFCDKNRDKPFSIVHGNRRSYHFWNDRRSTGPSLYYLPLSSLSRQLIDPFQQFILDKRTLLQRSTHGYLLLLRTIYFAVLLFLLVLYPFVGWPHGETGSRPPLAFPSPPPWGWSTGFMAVPRT